MKWHIIQYYSLYTVYTYGVMLLFFVYHSNLLARATDAMGSKETVIRQFMKILKLSIHIIISFIYERYTFDHSPSMNLSEILFGHGLAEEHHVVSGQEFLLREPMKVHVIPVAVELNENLHNQTGRDEN